MLLFLLPSFAVLEECLFVAVTTVVVVVVAVAVVVASFAVVDVVIVIVDVVVFVTKFCSSRSVFLLQW